MPKIDHAAVIKATGKRPPVKTELAAAYLGFSPVTLECDRSTGRLGIPFMKAGRSVNYDLDDLDDWKRQRRVAREPAKHLSAADTNAARAVGR
jgi:hypothetical protein